MIDTNNWGMFPIIELFALSLPKGDLQVKKVVEGETPLITPSSFNNGLLKRISKHSVSTLYKQGAITVDMFGNAYYQDEDFFVTAHGHVNVLIPKIKINMFIGAFVATAIRTMFLEKYGFNEMCTQKVLKNESIKLPVTSNGRPDWFYMESYMKQIMQKAKQRLNNLNGINSSIHLIDITAWKKYRIGNLFEVVKGTRLTKADMKEGTIRFIGSSAMNNGETNRIANDDHLHPANTITVCYNGSVGETFYQDEVFWASDDVNVLYPKFEMNQFIGLFICPIIKSIGQKYAFIDKWKQEVMKEDTILLPATPDGQPDWTFIESYMKQIMAESEKGLEILKTVLK